MSVSWNSVTVITPGSGSSITSTTTVSTEGAVDGFIVCALCAPLRVVLLRIRFARFAFVDNETLRALFRAADFPVARFVLRAFAFVFRFAMIYPPPI